jgi:hypothetical protein
VNNVTAMNESPSNWKKSSSIPTGVKSRTRSQMAISVVSTSSRGATGGSKKSGRVKTSLAVLATGSMVIREGSDSLCSP